MVDTFRARTDIDFDYIQLSCQDGTDPETIAVWSDAPPYPSDLIVLVIDARDSNALAQLPFWTARLADQGATRAAIVIGDDARDPNAPWRRELTASFDGVIDVCPQPSILRAASVAILTEVLLMLRSSIISYDSRDVRDMLHSGPILRTAATVWNQSSKGAVAVRKLWDTLQPTHVCGVLAILHAANNVNVSIIAEFIWLGDQLRELLPDDAHCCVVTVLLHDDGVGA